MAQKHSFHIPVLGVGYSIDAPIKVAHYGITSVLSLTDYIVIEKLYKYYCQKENEPFTEYKGKDANSQWITTYLNLVNKLVQRNFNKLKSSPFEKGSEIIKYFELLPETSPLKQKYQTLESLPDEQKKELQQWLRTQITPGSIDVNIMTKLDRAHYASDGSQLPQEYNDAHAALRGYAQSDLISSVVFSAGMNPRLFSYMEQFADFYPGENGFKKQIILKVTDYRSALIQGKILAKKGLWISEFRVESGLNTGGHAFATDGYLLGPILEEFKNNRNVLYQEMFTLYTNALKAKNISLTINPTMRVTAQGGVGTAGEHNFLLRYYQLDSIGWGSPFLLVPEVMNVDKETLETLCKAKEEDFYISDASPLGIKFINFRPSSMHAEKNKRLQNGDPGFSCRKSALVTDTTFTEKPICTASKKYMREKIKQIEQQNLTPKEKENAINKMAEKSCLCIGLSTSVLKFYNLPLEGDYVTMCPGSNLVYFKGIFEMKELVDHIYGRTNLINMPRPAMFVQELSLYVNYLKKLIEENKAQPTEKNKQHIANFRNKLFEGIQYYHKLIPEIKEEPEKVKKETSNALMKFETILQEMLVD